MTGPGRYPRPRTRSGFLRWAAVAVVALAAAAGCGGAPDGGPDSGPVLTLPPLPPETTAPPTTAPADQGPVYVLTGTLCDRADVSALADLYPTADTPLTNSARLCATARSSDRSVVSLSIDAELLRDGRWAREYFDTSRRLAQDSPTDIPGAGSGAFWTGDERTVELFSFHGNLVLQIRLRTVRDADKLPADAADRLARVAAGTFARLAP
nr:hypothetical protein [Micromonospora sp. DSM 115978]